MKNNPIFDMKNIYDIPEGLRNYLSKSKEKTYKDMLLSLFDIKKELTRQEMIVGLIRDYKLDKSQQWFSNLISQHMRRGNIKRIETNLYEKVSKPK